MTRPLTTREVTALRQWDDRGVMRSVVVGTIAAMFGVETTSVETTDRNIRYAPGQPCICLGKWPVCDECPLRAEHKAKKARFAAEHCAQCHYGPWNAEDDQCNARMPCEPMMLRCESPDCPPECLAKHDCPWCHGTGRIVGWRERPLNPQTMRSFDGPFRFEGPDTRTPAEGDGEEPEGCWERQEAWWEAIDLIGIWTVTRVARGAIESAPQIASFWDSMRKLSQNEKARPRECSILAADPDARDTALRDAGVVTTGGTDE